MRRKRQGEPGYHHLPRRRERRLTGTNGLHYAPTTPWGSCGRQGATTVGHLAAHTTLSTEGTDAKGDPGTGCVQQALLGRCE